MTPFQTFFLALSLIAFALAWFKGGRPERAATATFVACYVASVVLAPLSLGGVRIGEALVDAATLPVFLWLALRHDRWSLLAIVAVFVLTMAVHATALAGLTAPRTDVAARWGLGVLMMLFLMAGVAERFLAGEAGPRRSRPRA